MTLTNDEAVAMIKERRDSRDCSKCSQDNLNRCKLCYITADKYYYKEKGDEQD